MENRKAIGRISGTISWFFEKINETEKSLARLTENKEQKQQDTNY